MLKRTVPNWVLPILSVIAVLVCLEAALALFWPHKIVVHPYQEQYDPVLGWSNKPGVRGAVQITRTLSFHRTHNGKGLRSLREIAYEKPAGIKRILLLGDSFFWGFGVNDEEVVSEVLQRDLGGGWEVVNGSVTGYGTDQELLWLTEEGLKYRPDIVVLGFFPTNDIDEISRSVMYNHPKPFFELAGKKLVLHNVPVPDTRETRRKAFERPDTALGRIKMFLRHHTHTYPFVAGRLNSVPFLRQVFLDLGLAEEFTTAMPGVMQYELHLDRVQDLSDALLLEVRRRTVQAGARFLLVHIPRREQGPPGSDELVYGKPPRVWNDEAGRFLASFTRENRMDLIDLLPVVRRLEEQGEVLYYRLPTEHHWTPRGHAVAAEAIAGWVRQNDTGKIR